ncbi:MAG: type II toxin-antitoxin system Phd/YefM family antitoxin [Vicinamibacterales bacterium]|nr:type II toxin-antitoxin system Phd/YefM family antitoxin [Vicinamibacterales bacterium]
MSNETRTVAAGTFKARCLALLDEVAATGESLTVTKRGKPVARLVPVDAPKPLLGSIRRQRNLVAPISVSWDADR